MILRSRRLQRVVHSFYPNPSNAAAEPAQILVQKPFKTGFSRRLLSPPVHNEYPVKAASTAPVIIAPQVRRTRKTEQFEAEFVHLILSTLSYAPWPSYKAQKVHRRHQKRRLLLPADILLRPLKAPVAEQPPTAFLAKKSIRTDFGRELLRPPEHNVYPPRATPFVAYALNGWFRRVGNDRKLLVPSVVTEWPATPAIPFQTATLFRSVAIRRRETHRGIRFQPRLASYKERPRLMGVFRSGFKPEVAYLVCDMSEIGYLVGAMSDIGYFVTWIGDYTAYLDGEMTDIGYLIGDIE